VTDRTDRIDRADSTYRGGEICFCVCGIDGREGEREKERESE
jgi:hypothetical protein